MGNKRRWWLKLEYIFFEDKAVRALRRKNAAAPDIYLKIMLQSLRNECRMKYQHYEDTLAEEIAGDINEDNVELVEDVIQFLIKHELMIPEGDEAYYFPQAADMSGSETDSAGRMRDKRERDKIKAMSQSDDNMSHCSVIITETESEQEKEKESYTESETHAASVPDSESAFSFGFEDIEKICRDNHIKATEADIWTYLEEMNTAEWRDSKGNIIKNIGAHIRTWLKYNSAFIWKFGDDVLCFSNTVDEISSLIYGLNSPLLREDIQQSVHVIYQQADQEALSGKHSCYAVLEQACKYLRENGLHFTETQKLLLESITKKYAWIFFDYCDSKQLSAVYENIAGMPPKWDEEEMKAVDNGEYQGRRWINPKDDPDYFEEV